MNKTGLAASLLFAFSLVQFLPSLCAAEGTSDLGPQIQIAIPGTGDYDLYESGLGLEVQYRNWVNGPLGFMLAVGYAEWQADSGANDPGSNLYDFDGNIELVPIGVSAVYEAFSGDDYNVTLECGLRYLFVDSKISARNSDQSPAARYDVSIDDTTVARIGVDVDYVLNEDFTLSVGVLYQVDLENGSLSTELGPARDNNMDAFMTQIALRMPL